MNDGDRAGTWGGGNYGCWADATPSAFPDWVQVDFNGSKTINEIDFFSLQDNYLNPVEPTEAMTFATYGNQAFDVQYWTGSAWATVPGGSITGNNKVWRKFTFSAITTTKIRVVSNASPDGWSRLMEVEAWTPEPPAASGGVQWLVADHLGTPRMVFDQTGSLANVSRHDYLPFGEELYAGTGGRPTTQGYGGDNVRQKFTQKERDNETGLDYFLARYYSSNQGRFASPDEFSGGPDELYDFADDASENPTFYAELDNPQSLNKYQYTYNNPLNFTDDDGHHPLAAAAAAAAILILLSPDTTHGPRRSDPRPLSRSGDGVGQLFVNAAAGAIGGPIISKITGKIFGAVTGRLGAATQSAALQAERQKIARLMHIRELGLDPATKGFRAAEGQAGFRLEAQIGRRLTRESTGALDFVEKGSGRTYELVGAGLKSQHFSYDVLTQKIVSDLRVADRVAVDVSRLSRAQAASIRQFVSGLSREQGSRVIILR